MVSGRSVAVSAACAAVLIHSLAVQAAPAVVGDLDPRPFGDAHPALDGWATGAWRQAEAQANAAMQGLDPAVAKRRAAQGRPFPLDVPRRDVIAFALYTVTVRPESRGTLKLSAQLFPLVAGESREARLEIKRGEAWEEVARGDVHYPGWDVNFRVAGWDSSRDWPYRVRHGDEAVFEGIVRRDPADKPEIVVGVLSCNSSSTPGPREELIAGLRKADPDLLFFAGDQTYRHTQHTVGWIEFGLQFRDVIRDRPTVTIPDDHDVGHPNLWGAGGKRSERKDGADGGYFYPAAYVNMVQRQQTWHLPDPVDPAPVAQGIGVFFTRLVVGGLDCAILEDRKFKTGPFGAIPEMGPRPDHITDPAYDRASIDTPGLELLGPRQLAWLERWGRDWEGVRAKTALSATAFAGAVHLHGSPDNRLLADLDCNGWPQTGRNAALKLLQAAHATHLCGDQHLAVVVKHGIEKHGDGPWSFTSPALVNTIYGRWWHPLDEQPGPNPVPASPLPWTGDYEDGLGNKISIVAYANPEDVDDEKQRGDGYGIARFDFAKDALTLECWPRFPVVGADGAAKQYPGWPVTVPLERAAAARPAPAASPAPAPAVSRRPEVDDPGGVRCRAGRYGLRGGPGGVAWCVSGRGYAPSSDTPRGLLPNSLMSPGTKTGKGSDGPQEERFQDGLEPTRKIRP
jgi:3',5'-cyclic AMP phosphodiesterase CpdA